MIPPLTEEWFWWCEILKEELSDYHDEIRRIFFEKW